MKIGIDCRSLNIQGGVKTYLINNLNEIGKIDRKNEYYLYYSSKDNLGTFKFNNFYEVVIPLKSRIGILFWEQIKLKNQVVKDKIEIFHGPKNTIPILLPNKIKKVVTILDLIPYMFKKDIKLFDRLYWKLFMPLSIKRCSKVIAISDSTKEDIKKYLPGFNNKIEVIYLGAKLNVNNNFNEVKKPFFMIVGALRQRKNIIRTIEAFNLFSSNKNFKVYIVGKNIDKASKINKLIKDLQLDNKVKVMGYISDKELKEMYKNASAYLYPSLYEGFGIPILEAQACGCPVITSNISSMPEVAGKGAILVDPYNIEEIAKAMEKIIKDKKLREELIKEGYKNIKRFSWEKCARETLKVYEEVYNER